MDANEKAGQQRHSNGTAHQHAVGKRRAGPGEIAAGGDADGDIVGQISIG